MPDLFNLRSTDTIIKSPAVKAPSSQSAITKPTGKVTQSITDPYLDERPALLVPRLVGAAVDDRRLHRVERSEHPGDRACSGIRIVWQEACMVLCDMEHDRP
ncbi:hypothetical protein FHS26_003112 [Rhizobium pisi]|uniref:Uncharacterized protein n=2 Tax=Rhizobium TaxID=379 RepID=A0A7W6B6M0_9HYPH|nr:hypothetical protein [Rhizobium pisi]MBB3915971.1 hypothetical protein [Rhizobium fabae]